MADKMKFNLVSPERELMSAEVDSVTVPGSEGEFGVLPHHAPLISTLMPGVIRVHLEGAEERIFVKGGFADVTASGLTILAEMAIPAEEMSTEIIARERAAAEAELASEMATADMRLSANRALEVLGSL